MEQNSALAKSDISSNNFALLPTELSKAYFALRKAGNRVSNTEAAGLKTQFNTRYVGAENSETLTSVEQNRVLIPDIVTGTNGLPTLSALTTLYLQEADRALATVEVSQPLSRVSGTDNGIYEIKLIYRLLKPPLPSEAYDKAKYQDTYMCRICPSVEMCEELTLALKAKNPVTALVIENSAVGVKVKAACLLVPVGFEYLEVEDSILEQLNLKKMMPKVSFDDRGVLQATLNIGSGEVNVVMPARGDLASVTEILEGKKIAPLFVQQSSTVGA